MRKKCAIMKKEFHVNFSNTPFLKTSNTGCYLNRLNWRTEMLLTGAPEAIANTKVLDLASHDGRFSFACLKLGAGHVTGVEARPHLVRNARENLLTQGFSARDFSFIQSDVFEHLAGVRPGEFDTILCLGFFYHTVRQIELLREINRIKPKYFILDTHVANELTEKKSRKQNLFLTLSKVIDQIKPGHFIKIRDSIQKAKPGPQNRSLSFFLNGTGSVIDKSVGAEK